MSLFHKSTLFRAAPFALTALIGLTASGEAMAQTRTLTIDNADRGAVNSRRALLFLTGKNFKVDDGSFQVRYATEIPGEPARAATRPYFTFSIEENGAPIPGRVISATLTFTHSSTSFDSPDSSETLRFYALDDFTPDELRNLETPSQPFPEADLVRLQEIFDDLGDGSVYGQLTASAANNGQTQTISLSSTGISAINRALAAEEPEFTLGADLATPAGQNNPNAFGVLERVFRASSENTDAVVLTLTIDESLEPVAPTPSPVLGGTFGLTLLGLGLGGTGLYRRRRR